MTQSAQKKATQAINTAIDKVITSQEKQNDAIQTVLLKMTKHALEFRDVSSFTRLTGGLKGADRKAIVKWSTEHAPVKFSKDGNATLNKALCKELNEQYSPETYDTLPHWTEASATMPEVVAQLDVLKRMQSLLKQVEEPKKPVKLVNDGAAKFLKDAIAKFEREASPVTQATRKTTVVAQKQAA